MNIIYQLILIPLSRKLKSAAFKVHITDERVAQKMYTLLLNLSLVWYEQGYEDHIFKKIKINLPINLLYLK